MKQPLQYQQCKQKKGISKIENNGNRYNRHINTNSESLRIIIHNTESLVPYKVVVDQNRVGTRLETSGNEKLDWLVPTKMTCRQRNSEYTSKCLRSNGERFDIFRFQFK